MSPEQGTMEAAMPVVRDLLTRLSGVDGETRLPGPWHSEGCGLQREGLTASLSERGVGVGKTSALFHLL